MPGGGRDRGFINPDLPGWDWRLRPRAARGTVPLERVPGTGGAR